MEEDNIQKVCFENTVVFNYASIKMVYNCYSQADNWLDFIKELDKEGYRVIANPDGSYSIERKTT